jgi:predicted  nucleic acid-binding Zn-ribbon protein
MMIMVCGSTAQTTMPDELIKNNIRDQIKYIENRTAIYENYRAVREDMFQKINRNILDTLSAGRSAIAGLNSVISQLNFKNDSLSTALDSTRVSLDKMTATKNSIRVLGIEINKNFYNTLMWIIILGLIFVLAVGFLTFKRILSASSSTSRELKDLRNEFEAYRQTARIAREKMSMDHFKEIQKLKGN